MEHGDVLHVQQTSSNCTILHKFSMEIVILFKCTIIIEVVDNVFKLSIAFFEHIIIPDSHKYLHIKDNSNPLTVLVLSCCLAFNT